MSEFFSENHDFCLVESNWFLIIERHASLLLNGSINWQFISRQDLFFILYENDIVGRLSNELNRWQLDLSRIGPCIARHRCNRLSRIKPRVVRLRD